MSFGMHPRMLLTSFDVWEPHHVSNASDDLLAELLNRQMLDETVQLLRKVVVDFQLAPEVIITKIQHMQPDVVVCCGMAERRSWLTVESNGTVASDTRYTTVDIHHLVQHLSHTKVSHNAGRFVCNYTHYMILKYIAEHQLKTDCIFVHVPVLNHQNIDAIVYDFFTILTRLRSKSNHLGTHSIDDYVRI